MDTDKNTVTGPEKEEKKNAGVRDSGDARRTFPKDEVLLVQEAMNLLEAKKFNEADEVCNLALKVNPNYAAAHIGKLMADLHVRRESELKEQARSYEKNENYLKALECANETMATQLQADMNQAKNHKRQIIIIFILVVILLLGTGVYLVVRVIIPEKERHENYQRAKQLIAEGKVDEAGKMLGDIGDYLDAGQIADFDPRMRYSAGKTVNFGAFEQDNNLENGQEPLEWIILKNDGENLFLLSKQGIAYKCFHPAPEGANWESSYIRSWLNGDFLAGSVNDREKKYIVPVRTDNSRSQIVSEEAETYDDGVPTDDSVFLLSQKEYEDYLSGLGDFAACTVTAAALREYSDAVNVDMDEMLKMIKEGRMDELGLLDVAWWLRTVRADRDEADVMSFVAGKTNKFYSYPETLLMVAVRPAMWVSLDAFRDGSGS